MLVWPPNPAWSAPPTLLGAGTDWKVLCVCADNALADRLQDITDIERCSTACSARCLLSIARALALSWDYGCDRV